LRCEKDATGEPGDSVTDGQPMIWDRLWAGRRAVLEIAQTLSSMARNHSCGAGFSPEPAGRSLTARIRRAALGFAVALSALASSAVGSEAEESKGGGARILAPLLPGLGAHDPRGRLDPDKVPWRAVGKLQATSLNLSGSCTGTLVGPSTVLTAAHCVYNPRTQRYFPPGSLHFLIGYNGSLYAGHAVGVKVETGPGYDPARPVETIGSDWALIWLGTKLGSADRILPIIGEQPELGSTVMLGGYQQDHPLVLTADPECRIVGRFVDMSGRSLLRHNCTGTRGVSGAPLLIEKGGKWHTAGIDVAAELGVASGLAVVLDEARSRF
jgi:protease YdgD